MKSNYRSFIKVINWVLAGILSLLGFSNCEDKYGPDEYGTPWADYTIKGSVVNKADGKPIKGIRVNIVPRYSEGMLMYGVMPTDYTPKSAVNPENWVDITNVDGAFKLSDRDIEVYFYPGLTPLAITDIDGEANGSFASDTLYVDFSDAEQTGKPKGWYGGELTKTVEVELTEKKTDE
jgi:putative lipoprotein (rSAM/lipoprotein system)